MLQRVRLSAAHAGPSSPARPCKHTFTPPRRNLGCANTACNLCKLSQRRRCTANFAAKYLAPCDVVEAKCGAQIYVVVQDEASGQLVQGLEDLAILVSEQRGACRACGRRCWAGGRAAT